MNSMLVLIPNCDDSPKTIGFLSNGPTMMVEHDMASDMNSLEPLAITVLECHDENLLIRLFRSGRKTVFDALDDMVVSNDMVDDDRPYVLLPKYWRDYNEFDHGLELDKTTTPWTWDRTGSDDRDKVYEKDWTKALEA